MRSIGSRRELWLSDVDDAGAKLIACALTPGRAHKLEVLRLGDQISDVGAVQLVDAIARGGTPRLRELHLSGNRLGDATAAALGEALCSPGTSQLLDLHLNHNSIGDEGAHRLSEALEQAPDSDALVVIHTS